MATYQKTILGGVVSQNVKLVVFLDPKTYLEVINEAKSYNIIAKTDSQLIRKILKLFFQDMPMKQMLIEQQKTALNQRDELIEQLRAEINETKIKSKLGKKKRNK